MLEIRYFSDAFIIKIGDPSHSRHGWFDTVEREYVENKVMWERYGTNQLDEKTLLNDLYIPVPVQYERDIVQSFLNEMNMMFLYDQYNMFKTRKDYTDFLNYKDERGCWIHDAYFAYAQDKEDAFIEQWIFDNRIMNAVVITPMPTEGVNGPDDPYRRPLITLKQRREANERDEVFYKLKQSIRRTKDNKLVPQVPYYKILVK